MKVEVTLLRARSEQVVRLGSIQVCDVSPRPWTAHGTAFVYSRAPCKVIDHHDFSPAKQRIPQNLFS